MKKFFYKLCILFFIFVLGFTNLSLCDDTDDEILDVNADIISDNTISASSNNIPETNSRACVVIDRNTNMILYGKNENQHRKMASTTKIMTALIIIENCNLDEKTEVSKKAAGTGGSRLGLKTGDKITIRDLLYGLMLRSGNDSAVALAEYTSGNIQSFSELMNKKAKDLGLTNTNFETPHGLDSDNHYTTAYELAILTNHALNNKIFAQIVGTKNYTVYINGNPKQLSNTNELLGNLNGVYGVKTGFTNGANRCLVTSCKRDNLDIICVVLGADTKKLRTSDSIKLINYVFNNYTTVNIQELINQKFDNWKKENLGTFIINKGESQDLNLKLGNLKYEYMPIQKNLVNNLSISINCQTLFEAPIFINSEIGNIEIFIENEPITICKIYTNSEIKRKSAYSYFIYIFKNFPTIIENSLI